MKFTTPETRVFTRVEFNAEVAILCGWTEIEPSLEFGKAPVHGARCRIPHVSQNLSNAWEILRHCQRAGHGSATEGGELYCEMVKLLRPDELWAKAPDDAAHMICNAFYEAHTGCDVEIEDPEDWED